MTGSLSIVIVPGKTGKCSYLPASSALTQRFKNYRLRKPSVLWFERFLVKGVKQDNPGSQGNQSRKHALSSQRLIVLLRSGQPILNCCSRRSFSLFLNPRPRMCLLILEREERGERERDIVVREKHLSVASHTRPNPRLNQQPRRVP